MKTDYAHLLLKIPAQKAHLKEEHKEKNAEEDSLVNKIIKQIKQIPEEDAHKVETFDKFEKNIGEFMHDEVTERSLAVTKNIEMNLAESTKLGTIRATSIRRLIKPQWHPPFKLYRVIVGHHGWVRCISVSPCNSFFATGSADRTIKFWDMASGELKISLTGHINTIRAL